MRIVVTYKWTCDPEEATVRADLLPPLGVTIVRHLFMSFDQISPTWFQRLVRRVNLWAPFRHQRTSRLRSDNSLTTLSSDASNFEWSLGATHHGIDLHSEPDETQFVVQDLTPSELKSVERVEVFPEILDALEDLSLRGVAELHSRRIMTVQNERLVMSSNILSSIQMITPTLNSAVYRIHDLKKLSPSVYENTILYFKQILVHRCVKQLATQTAAPSSVPFRTVGQLHM